MIDGLRELTALDWLITVWVCIVPLLHTYALADVILRRPAAATLLIGCPAVVVAAFAGAAVSGLPWIYPAALVVPCLQYWIVRWLYPEFQRRYGRRPRNVYEFSRAHPAASADRAFFAIGGFVLIAGPLMVAYALARLVSALFGSPWWISDA